MKKKREYEKNLNIPTTPERLAKAVLRTLTNEELDEIKSRTITEEK